MKKFLAIFLTVMMLISMTTMFVAASTPTKDGDVHCLNYFDFSAENNKWAERNPETNELVYKSFTDSDLVNGYYPHALLLENRSLPTGNKENLLESMDYEFTNDGEVLKVSSTDQNKTGGFVFRVASFNQFLAGAQASNGIEYIKIRIKNNSPSTNISFGAGVSNYGGGALDNRLRAHLDIEANSSEWKTYTFSIRDLNFDATGGYYWATYLREFAFFPFGYGSENEAIQGDQYYMEIDYIVMGSLEYVTGYESALEKKENSATNFEFISLPSTTTYYTGDRLDLTGLQAKITFNDNANETEIVDTASAVYNFEKPANLGDDVTSWETDIKLSYGQQYLSYKVTVVDIKNIEFETEQETSIYNRIDIKRNGFTPVGMTIRVNFADGTYKVKQLHEITLTGTDFSQSVQLSEQGYYPYIATANFYGHSLTFPVNIIDISEIILTPVEEKKNSVYYGTAISKDFFTVECKYTDGSVVALADTGLDSNFSVSCNTNIAGGEAVAKASIVNSAYEISISTETKITVQTPTALQASLNNKDKVKVDQVLSLSSLKVKYIYADGTEASVDTSDPALIVNYDTSAPGEKMGKVKLGSYVAEFDFKVRDVSAEDMTNSFVRDGGKVSLLKAKFPTGWLVTIIIASVVAFLVAAYCVLKYKFKVDFKPKKKFNLDEIF